MKEQVLNYLKELKELKKSVGLDKLKKEFTELEKKMSSSDLWDNPKRAKEITKRHTELKKIINHLRGRDRVVVILWPCGGQEPSSNLGPGLWARGLARI